MAGNDYDNILQNIILGLLARRNLDELLENILLSAGQIVNTSHGFIDLVNESTTELRMGVKMGLFNQIPNVPSKSGEGLVGKVWQSGEPLIVADYDTWEGRIPQRTMGLVKSAVGVPLKTADKVVGVLVLAHDRSSNETFKAQKVKSLSQFADLATLTIDNVRLYQSARLAAERLLILYSATHEISSSLEIEQVCAAIQHATEQIMPCDEFVIALYDAKSNEILPIYATEMQGKRVYPRKYVADHGLAGHIVHTGKTVLLNSEEEANNSQIAFETFGSEPNTLSILAVPLRLKDRILGMISAQSYNPNSYTPQDQELLEVLAAHAGAAIENAQLFSRTQHLATTDALTHVYNRHRFFELAEREFKRAHRYTRPLSVLMIDIDHFKVINDMYGHPVGDETLYIISRRIIEELRETDILGRYGGDEFIAILPETDGEQARLIAHRLCGELALIKIKDGRKTEPEITASIGIAALDPSQERLSILLERADRAMYAAKQGGRNQVQVWSTETKG